MFADVAVIEVSVVELVVDDCVVVLVVVVEDWEPVLVEVAVVED